jgi:hypothetical protein
MTRSLADQIAREAAGNGPQVIVPPPWAVEGARLLLLGMFLVVSTWAALWAVNWVDYGWSRFHAGIGYCSDGIVETELHGACKTIGCLEARTALIRERGQFAIKRGQRCLKNP